jgi:hypothetical protein
MSEHHRRNTMQLEIELAGNGMTIIKEIPDVCDWTHGRHPVGFEEVAGVDLLFTVGNDIGWNVRIYEPNGNGANRSGGRWLVAVTDGRGIMEFWCAHCGIALAFLREQSAVITAAMLSQLEDRYSDGGMDSRSFRSPLVKPPSKANRVD